MNQPYQHPPGAPVYQQPAAPQYPPQPQQPGMPPGFPQQPAAPVYQQPPAAPVYQQPPAAPQYQQPPAAGGGRRSLANARVGNGNGRKLPPGDYVVDVNTARVFNSKHYNNDFFIVEFTIAESSNPAVGIGDGGFSWSRPFEDKYGHGPNDIKGWICTIIEHLQPGSNPGAQWDDGYVAWVAEEEGQAGHPQPARGLRLHVNVWDKPHRNDPSKSTSIHDWRVMQPGESLGLSPAAMAAPMAAPAAMGQLPQMPGQMPLPPQPPVGAPPMPQPAPAAPVDRAPPQTGLPPSAPPGWPPNVPWPGAQ